MTPLQKKRFVITILWQLVPASLFYVWLGLGFEPIGKGILWLYWAAAIVNILGAFVPDSMIDADPSMTLASSNIATLSGVSAAFIFACIGHVWLASLYFCGICAGSRWARVEIKKTRKVTASDTDQTFAE